MIHADVKIGQFTDFVYTLLEQTKSKKFRAGFIKKDGTYRVGKFDLLHRGKWKQSDGTMYVRKGKARTTSPDEYILAHDLENKQPRNISFNRLLWIGVGKKLYRINRYKTGDESIRVFEFERVKFSGLKDLLKGNINLEEIQ